MALAIVQKSHSAVDLSHLDRSPPNPAAMYADYYLNKDRVKLPPTNPNQGSITPQSWMNGMGSHALDAIVQEQRNKFLASFSCPSKEALQAIYEKDPRAVVSARNIVWQVIQRRLEPIIPRVYLPLPRNCTFADEKNHYPDPTFILTFNNEKERDQFLANIPGCAELAPNSNHDRVYIRPKGLTEPKQVYNALVKTFGDGFKLPQFHENSPDLDLATLCPEVFSSLKLSSLFHKQVEISQLQRLEKIFSDVIPARKPPSILGMLADRSQKTVL